MGKITGFLEIDRQDRTYEPAADRIRHYREFLVPISDAEVASKRPAAWIAASPIVTRAAR